VQQSCCESQPLSSLEARPRNSVELGHVAGRLEYPLGKPNENPPPAVASGGFSVLSVLLEEHVLERVKNVPDLRFESCVPQVEQLME